MIFLFLISQTIIPDFQVNNEDYPSSRPQIFPTIATYDSGGAIVWYDLRMSANGLLVFGTLIDISGDTINKNFCLNDDTTTGCINQPSIDNDTAGNFIIVYIQRQNVLMRRFNKFGIPYGPSFTVNANPECAYPSIAVSQSGRFVIVWLKTGENRIYGQIFDPNGNPVGTNFLISDSIVSYNNPGVAIGNNNNFIASWQYKNEIWAQVFDSLGNRIGENFRLINDTMSTSENYPRLRFDSQNNLFVSWMASTGGQGDVNCQIFDSTLTPITDIIKLDGNGIDSAQYQAIAIKDSIWFVVFQNGRNAVYLQRVKNNGELIGNNIRISEPVGTRHTNPKIDFTSQYFVITWSRCLGGSIFDIVCQKVSFDGNLIGNNYVISDDKGGDPQVFPGVAVDEGGNFFVVWSDYRRYPDYYDVPRSYGRRYDAQGNPYGDEFRINTYTNADYSTIAVNSNIYLVAWSRTHTALNHQIYAQRFAHNGNPIDTNYQISLSPGTNELSSPKITTLSNNHFVVIWKENISNIDRIYGRILDPIGLPYGTQFNPYVDSSVYNKGGSAVDERNGKFVVPILCSNIDSTVVAIQEFDYNGNPVSGPIIINESPASYNSVCGAKGIERYLFVWIDAQSTKIIGQFLDNNLQKIGNNFNISEDTVSEKNAFFVVSNDDGKFFVIWNNFRNDNSDLYGQFFSSEGNKIGNNFRVDNDTTNAEQSYPYCYSAHNRIYIVWHDTRILSHWFDIYCKVIGWPDGQEIEEREIKDNSITFKVYPNPFTNRLDIRCRIQDAGLNNVGQGVSLAIYDVAGRLIKRYINPPENIVWNGRDEYGRAVSPGVYFIRIDNPDNKQTFTHKIIKLE